MRKNSLLHTLHTITVFALPLSAGSVINMLISFISMMMVASVGKHDLAAGALAVPTFMTLMIVTSTISYAVGILISHQKGQDKTQSEIGLIVKNGCWLAVMLAFPSAIALWNVDKLLLLFGQDPSLVAKTRGYFHFAAFCMFPVLINSVIAQFYAGIGKPRFTMWIALISMPFTLFFAYILILGHFGLPAMGLSGITCATLIVQSLILLGVIFLLYWQERAEPLPYSLFNQISLPDWTICKSIFSLGLPIGMQFGGELAAMTCATYLMGHFGVTALAATQIVSQYTMLAVVLILGLTQALSILTSQAMGKKDVSLVKEYLHASILLIIIFCSVVSILFLNFPKALIQFYMSNKMLDAHLQHLATVFLAISACLIFVDALRHILSGALRGLHDSQGPMRIGIIAMWLVALPMSYLTGMVFHGGPIGLRLGFVSGFIFAVVLLVLRTRKKLHYLEEMYA